MNLLFIDNHDSKTCQICNKQFKHLGLHLNYSHKDITHKEYYDKYLKLEGEGFCYTCNKPLKFYDLTHGYQHYCNAKCELADKRVIEKAKETYKANTGFDHNMHNPESKARVKNTTINHFGGIGFAVKELKQKSINTYNKEHNTTITEPGMIVHLEPELEQQRINTRRNNNNGSYNSELQNRRIKESVNNPKVQYSKVQTRREKYGDKYMSNIAYENLQNKPYDTYSYANMIEFHPSYHGPCICHCNICNNNYKIDLKTLRSRHTNNLPLCTICNPLEKQYSMKEKELLKFIQENYTGEIIENDRTILNGKEIDIYLPELKLGFEFDGTYWHADPRFYSENDIIDGKNLIAKDIWERERIKDNIAINHDINLIHVKEYDWDNDKINILNYIKSIL